MVSIKTVIVPIHYLSETKTFDKKLNELFEQGYTLIDPKYVDGQSIQICETENEGTMMVAYLVKVPFVKDF